jgi:hypothetical protein
MCRTFAISQVYANASTGEAADELDPVPGPAAETGRIAAGDPARRGGLTGLAISSTRPMS